MSEDYFTHTEADAGLWARAHAEPDDRPTLAELERDEQEPCSCGQDCSAYFDEGEDE